MVLTPNAELLSKLVKRLADGAGEKHYGIYTIDKHTEIQTLTWNIYLPELQKHPQYTNMFSVSIKLVASKGTYYFKVDNMSSEVDIMKLLDQKGLADEIRVIFSKCRLGTISIPFTDVVFIILKRFDTLLDGKDNHIVTRTHEKVLYTQQEEQIAELHKRNTELDATIHILQTDAIKFATDSQQKINAANLRIETLEAHFEQFGKSHNSIKPCVEHLIATQKFDPNFNFASIESTGEFLPQ